MKIKMISTLLVALFFLTSCDPISNTTNNTNKSQESSDVKITSIEITENQISLVEGKSVKLIYKISPTNTTENYFLSTSNKYVATIDGYGTITGVSTGSAIIKIYNSSNTIYDTCSVNVAQKIYSIKDNIIKDNFESCINDLFYLRDNTGAIVTNSALGVKIVVAKIKFNNKRSSSVYTSSGYFSLINNSNQHNNITYNKLCYDPEGVVFSLNGEQYMAPGTSRTMYVAFYDFSDALSNYRINCDNNYDYDFDVSFLSSEIR